MVNRRSEKIGDYDGLYATVTINEPSAVFEDKTIDYKMFLDDYHSDKLSNVVKEMTNGIVHVVARQVTGNLKVFHWILQFR